MEGSMHNTENKPTTGRKWVKPKALKSDALAAGLAAFQALESAEGATRPVIATAKTLVEEGIESIMRSRARGVPLLRIYSDAKKAAGLRISFATFSGYVCDAAKAAGIKLEKPKADTGAIPRTGPEPGPAPVADGALVGDEEAAGGAIEWGCDRCESESVRRERDGKAWWQCPACRTLWADDGGQIVNRRLNTRKPEGNGDETAS